MAARPQVEAGERRGCESPANVDAAHAAAAEQAPERPIQLLAPSAHALPPLRSRSGSSTAASVGLAQPSTSVILVERQPVSASLSVAPHSHYP